MAFAVLALATQVQAQTGSAGRKLFVQKNCKQCHFYEARSFGPSLKKMKQALKGDPNKALAGISASEHHATDLKTLTSEDVRSISEWIASAKFDAAVTASKVPTAPAVSAAPTAPTSDSAGPSRAEVKAWEESSAKAAALVQARRDIVAKAQAGQDESAQKPVTQQSSATVKLAQKAAEKEEVAKKEAERRDALKKEALQKQAEKKEAAKKEAERREALKKEALQKQAEKREALKKEAEKKAQAKRDADALAAHEAVAQREAADLARREADAKARKDTAALAALKRESDEKAKREAEAQASAKREAEARAKRDAEALAAQKRDAEAKAKADAALLAAQKKAEVVVKLDVPAKPEALVKPEPPVAAKKSEVLAMVEPAKTEPPPVKVEAAAKADAPASSGKKKDIGYRDGSDLPPCEAPTGAPIGVVDEDRAKAIIERVGCPQCHAYVQKKTGPPMKKIQEKYKGDWECVVFRLKKNRTHGEEGVTADLKGAEFKIIGDYIATRKR